MGDILPPQAGLSVNGLIYQYTIVKDPETDSWVTIQNLNPDGTCCVLSNTDDWSGLPGNTINSRLTFGAIPSSALGDGSIFVTGDGTLSDVNVGYSFVFDTCFNPLSDPTCPGFRDAYFQWLLDNGLLAYGTTIDDPTVDQYIDDMLNKKADFSDEEVVAEEPKDEEIDKDSLEAKMSVSDNNMKVAEAAKQNAMLDVLRMMPASYDSYLNATISGGVYEETVVLQDATLPDNASVMTNLAQDTLHRTMVRAQYDGNP